MADEKLPPEEKEEAVAAASPSTEADELLKRCHAQSRSVWIARMGCPQAAGIPPSWRYRPKRSIGNFTYHDVYAVFKVHGRGANRFSYTSTKTRGFRGYA